MIVGIDLGTTNSLIAYWDGGQAKIIPNALGELLTPSIISFDQASETFLIGKPALFRAVTNPEHTISNFKRFMGSAKTFQLGSYSLRAEELSSLILKQLKEDAESYLGIPIEEAVISVPAYFSHAQRKATKNAGKLAGLKVERLINEPTAAGIAYGIQEKLEETNYLIFDLGGGTFDVSIIHMFSGIIEVRASSGDNTLGGLDFTQVLAEMFFDHHLTNKEIKNEEITISFRQKVFEAAELCKHILNINDEPKMSVNWKSKLYDFSFTLKDFEKRAEPLLERLVDPVKKVLSDAKLTPSAIDQVILVGGACRMLVVKNLVGRMFRKFPLSHIDPDKAIAQGAAIQAGLKVCDKALDEIVVTDVSPYSLGVAAYTHDQSRGTGIVYFDPIIERNTIIPASRSRIFHPAEQNQRFVEIKIYQGESFYVEKNILLGTLSVEIPNGLKDRSFEIRFTYDINGLLEVEATFIEANTTSRLIIEGNPGTLSENEIKKRLLELRSLKLHPREQTENKLLLNRAEHLFEDLQGEKRTLLASWIQIFISSLNTQDPMHINKIRKEFEKLLDSLHNQITLI